ncbi:CCDC124 [Cordylochernes scorpioides]|uniref:CCDC124 n=1 Tax=Cordylochernes scorpioides TaxID=51811 RepID=A0ABY6LKF9_9ARAC|nr:CCDC124 [Cordylochernes scorpioides]
MPKKFGTNSKSQAAWDRKEAAKVAELQRKEKEEEEANWKDDNKHVMKKQQRKESKIFDTKSFSKICSYTFDILIFAGEGLVVNQVQVWNTNLSDLM